MYVCLSVELFGPDRNIYADIFIQFHTPLSLSAALHSC